MSLERRLGPISPYAEKPRKYVQMQSFERGIIPQVETIIGGGVVTCKGNGQFLDT